MSELSDQQVLEQLGDFLDKHDLDIHYTIDDDGLHIQRGDREIFIGFSHNLPSSCTSLEIDMANG